MCTSLPVVGSHALLKQAYDKHLRELQQEVDELQKERIELVQARPGGLGG